MISCWGRSLDLLSLSVHEVSVSGYALLSVCPLQFLMYGKSFEATQVNMWFLSDWKITLVCEAEIVCSIHCDWITKLAL